MYQRILSPIDGSPTSDRGMAEAIALAKDQGARLRFVHVVDLQPPLLNLGGLAVLPDLSDLVRRDGEQLVERALQAAADAQVEADRVIVESQGGRIADLVLREAAHWPADLIVMGTHGRRGASGLLLGSDAQSVLREARVPVLLVRAPAA